VRRFGAQIVRAEVRSSTALVCRAPPAAARAPGNVSLAVSLNGEPAPHTGIFHRAYGAEWCQTSRPRG